MRSAKPSISFSAVSTRWSLPIGSPSASPWLPAAGDTCARRIASRDASRQIVVSAELIREMHARTEALDVSWGLVLDNDPPVSEWDVGAALDELMGG